MTYKYLSYSISAAFISFIVGMMVTALLKKTKLYNSTLSNLNLVKSDAWNTWLGVDLVKWIVKNTPAKYFNQKLKLKPKVEKDDLHLLRQEMTSSEVEHLVGFVFVTLVAFTKFYQAKWLFGFTVMIVNVLMNLNPSLLQQQNKRRIDRLSRKLGNGW